jgi:alpha-tubulin suppressor-like RCC1 family protein/flagellar biosynthesis protein FliR
VARVVLAATAVVISTLVAVPVAQAATSNGSVHAFGTNVYGELGVPSTGPMTCGTITCSNVPVSSGGLTTGAATIAAGARHSLAILPDGTIKAWGRNQAGELGNGLTTDLSTPVQVLTSTVGPVKLSGVIAVNGNASPITTTSLSGDGHSLALRSDGTVWAWGQNSSGEQGVDPGLNSLDNCGTAIPCSLVARQVPGLSGVTSIAAGASFSLALKSDGSVWAWGLNASSQLGVGFTGQACGSLLKPCSWTPVQVTGLGAGSGVVQVAAGSAFAMALKADGTVLTWGLNNVGELGNGTTTSSSTPVQAFGPGSAVTQITAGDAFALALKGDGSMSSWGNNKTGDLGNGTTTGPSTCGATFIPCGLVPAPVVGIGASSGVTSISAGFAHSIVLKSNGTVMVWGHNNSGQLGDGTTGTDEPTPKALALTHVTQVSAGGSHTLVLQLNLPGAPGSPSALPGNTTAKVSWTAAASNGSAITGYVVTPYIGFSPQAAQTYLSTALTQTLTGLVNGTTYFFKIAAINSAGTGPSSNTPAITVGAPLAPPYPSAQPGNTTAKVSWKAPVANASPITGYVVTPYVGATAQAAQTFLSTALTQTLTGFTNGTTYTFKVAAINAFGTGPVSTTTIITEGTPTSPPLPSAAPGNTTAQVSWFAATANASAITGYVVTPVVGTTAQASRTFVSTATTQTITGLVNGTTYTFRVAAINSFGTGPYSITATLKVGIPGVPTGVSAIAGSLSATVSWTAAPDNGTAITSYVVTPYIGATAQAARTFTSNATTEVVTGLAAGSIYTFRVKAINALGTGASSSASNAVTVLA